MTTKTKSKKTKPKAEKKTQAPKAITSEELFGKVRDIAITRKAEIQDNPELSGAICEFVDKLGEDILSVIGPAIQTGSPADIKKDKLLVLQLLYLRLGGELLETGHKIETESDIPISGCIGVKPIDCTHNTVPIYL